VNNAGLNYKISGDTVYNFWQIYHHLGGGVQSLLGKRDLPLPAGIMTFFLFLVWKG
jgi:hypothetical protein